MATETTVSLELTPEEVDALSDSLAGYLSDLSVEISDTESQPFRDRLKQQQVLLRNVLQKLDRLRS